MTVLASHVLASNPGVSGVSGVPAHQAPALAASADCIWGPGSTAPQNHVSANQTWGHEGRRTQRKQESDVRDLAFSTSQSTQKQVNDQLQQVIMQQNRYTRVGQQPQEGNGNGCVPASAQADSACLPDAACSSVMIKEEGPPNQAVTLCDKDKDVSSDNPSSSISGADLEVLKRKAPDTCTDLPLHRCLYVCMCVCVTVCVCVWCVVCVVCGCFCAFFVCERESVCLYRCTCVYI